MKWFLLSFVAFAFVLLAVTGSVMAAAPTGICVQNIKGAEQVGDKMYAVNPTNPSVVEVYSHQSAISPMQKCDLKYERNIGPFADLEFRGGLAHTGGILIATVDAANGDDYIVGINTLTGQLDPSLSVKVQTANPWAYLTDVGYVDGKVLVAQDNFTVRSYLWGSAHGLPHGSPVGNWFSPSIPLFGIGNNSGYTSCYQVIAGDGQGEYGLRAFCPASGKYPGPNEPLSSINSYDSLGSGRCGELLITSYGPGVPGGLVRTLEAHKDVFSDDICSTK